MLDVISKADYFSARNDPELEAHLHRVSRDHWGMKHIQDAWALTQLLPVRDSRILEVGGGHSRVLRCLDASNEMVNLDKLEGKDGGPTGRTAAADYTVVNANMGEFHPDIKDNSFDRIFSISVMEHIPGPAYDAFWEDHARALKPGGLGIHAIDVYITDEADPQVEKRLESYRAFEKAGLRLVGEDALPRPLIFRSHFGSCSDYVMAMWNKQAPKLAHRRESYQCVSLKLMVTKD